MLSLDTVAGDRLRRTRVVAPEVRGFTQVVGRDDDLDSLRRVLTDTQQQGVPGLCILSGLGGIGKTSLARKYANLYQEEYGLVWWVHAETRSAVPGEFRGLLEVLAPDDAHRVDDPVPAVHIVLANRDKPWLLVLDNVPNADGLDGLLPAAGIGHVIVTTRSSDWPRTYPVMPVHPLSQSAAIDLLTSLSGDGDAQAAASLADLLGQLPLALAQAGCYTAQTRMTLADYTRLYITRRRDMHSVGRVPDYHRDIATTLQLSFDRLTTSARAILNLACWYASDELPLNRLLLSSTDGADRLESLPADVTVAVQPIVTDELELQRAVRNLTDYSLVSYGGEYGSIEVHRLVQAVTADNLVGEGWDALWRASAARLLAVACPRPQAGRTDLGLWRQLQTHVRTILDHLDPDLPVTLQLRHNLACWTGHVGNLTGATELAAALLKDRIRLLGPQDPDTLATLHELAHWTGRADKHTAEALALSRTALVGREATIGADHPDTLETRLDITRWVGDMGDPAQALHLLNELLPDCQRVLGERHKCTLDTRSAIAFLTGQVRSANEARDLYARLVDDVSRFLGSHDISTLRARQNYAYWTARSGDPESGLRMFDEVLCDRETLLGLEHPHTLVTRHSVAFWAGKLRTPAQAVDLLRELVPVYDRVFGPLHSSTVGLQWNIARALESSGDPAAGLRLREELLPIARNVWGDRHVETLRLRHEIACRIGESRSKNEAVHLLSELTTDYEDAYGREHEETIWVRRNLAYWIEEASDDPAAGLQLRKELLPLARNVWGDRHPETLRLHHEIAYRIGSSGNKDEAVHVFDELATDYQSFYGLEHEETIWVRRNLAYWIEEASDDPAAGLQLRKELLPLARNVWGDRHPETLRLRHEIAYRIGSSGNKDEAVRMLRELATDYEEYYGREHQETLGVLHNIDLFEMGANG